jgi:hypothetical protein
VESVKKGMHRRGEVRVAVGRRVVCSRLQERRVSVSMVRKWGSGREEMGHVRENNIRQNNIKTDLGRKG